MSKRIFSEEQIKELLQNPNVVNCSDKSITYKNEFKVSAVKKYHEGVAPRDIFRDAKINIAIVGNKTPKWCLKRWLKIFREKGAIGLSKDNRKSNNPQGRPKSIKHFSDKEKLKYLEAEVAYLKAENNFLAKLRKKS